MRTVTFPLRSWTVRDSPSFCRLWIATRLPRSLSSCCRLLRSGEPAMCSRPARGSSGLSPWGRPSGRPLFLPACGRRRLGVGLGRCCLGAAIGRPCGRSLPSSLWMPCAMLRPGRPAGRPRSLRGRGLAAGDRPSWVGRFLGALSRQICPARAGARPVGVGVARVWVYAALRADFRGLRRCRFPGLFSLPMRARALQ